MLYEVHSSAFDRNRISPDPTTVPNICKDNVSALFMVWDRIHMFQLSSILQADESLSNFKTGFKNLSL